MKTQIIALAASLLLASSVFAHEDKKHEEHKDHKHHEMKAEDSKEDKHEHKEEAAK